MKILKKIMIFLFSIITIFIVVYITTIKLYPSFGGDLTSNQKVQFEQFKNFENGQFKNRRSVPEKLTFSKFFELGYKYFTTELVNGKPTDDFGIVKITSEIISSIFPEKLQFDGIKCRTPRINDALRYILQIDKNLEEKNKGQF